MPEQMSDEQKIREYMAAKMKHIKTYNECMNLVDGLDVAKFAELVRADEREACAKLCEEILEPWLLREYIDKTVDAIRARGEK